MLSPAEITKSNGLVLCKLNIRSAMRVSSWPPVPQSPISAKRKRSFAGEAAMIERGAIIAPAPIVARESKACRLVILLFKTRTSTMNLGSISEMLKAVEVSEWSFQSSKDEAFKTDNRDLVIPRPSTAAFESQIPQRRLRQSALEAHRSTQSLNSNPIYFERKDVRIISANRVCCKAARETVPVAHD